jgi:hypothetical protein
MCVRVTVDAKDDRLSILGGRRKMSSFDEVHKDSPDDPWDRRPEVRNEEARSITRGPAIALILLGMINALLGAVVLVGGLELIPMSVDEFESQMTKDDPNALDDLIEHGFSVDSIKEISTYICLSVGAIGLMAAVILVGGGTCMLVLKFYWLAFLAGLVAIISPGGCFVFGLVGGVWSLVQLVRPEVRRAFS